MSMTPREIVHELNRHIIGQDDAKRAVAIALRNRWRRMQLPAELRNEVMPKNILMIGPTGVGKTEISRRLAKLAGAPFVKVEATKFTEVGYVGRDVDQIMRDLVESALVMVRDKRRVEVRARAEAAAENRILDALVGSAPLFPHQREVEWSWRILDPVLDHWAGQGQPEQLEQAQYPVDGTGAPAAIQQGGDGAIGDEQENEGQGKGALGNQKAGQVIHHYGAAPAKLEGHEKDGDAKQAGQQQLDAGP